MQFEFWVLLFEFSKKKKKKVKYIFFGEINLENFTFMFTAKGFMNIV